MTAARVSVVVGRRTLSLSNLDKVLWPRDGLTKGDMIAYYERIAPFILPHLRGRPLMLERYPNGIDAPSFFEKQTPKGTPEWVQRVTVAKPDGRRAEIAYTVCNDAPSLVYLANLAVVTLHEWTSRVDALDEPDFALFDLDPGETCTLKTLARVALHLRDTLHAIGVTTLAKTSGGYGLHVVAPLAPGYTYDTVKMFAALLAHRVRQDLGDAATLERNLAKRPSSAVYLDYVQVGEGKTIVAPFSARARDGAPVSMTLDWSEVEAFGRTRAKRLPADAFTAFNLRNAPARLEREGDRWAGKAWKPNRLEPALARARKLWS